MRELTKKQADVLAYIVRICLTEFRYPTYREIASEFRVQLNSAYCHVKSLKRKGWLEIDKNGTKDSIRLSGKTRDRFAVDSLDRSLIVDIVDICRKNPGNVSDMILRRIGDGDF